MQSNVHCKIAEHKTVQQFCTTQSGQMQSREVWQGLGCWHRVRICPWRLDKGVTCTQPTLLQLSSCGSSFRYTYMSSYRYSPHKWLVDIGVICTQPSLQLSSKSRPCEDPQIYIAMSSCRLSYGACHALIFFLINGYLLHNYLTHKFPHIWVSFCRAGISAVLHQFFC